MITLNVIFVLLFTILIQNGVVNCQEKVNITVYYESLCPDSIEFITGQLYPTYQSLEKYLNVEFVPFGNAEFKSDGTGGWTFTCQHGPEECEGNLYQVCLLDKLAVNSVQVEAVHCMMADDHPDQATKKCMNELGIPNYYDDVNLCHSSNYGENLLKQNGEATNNLIPEHYFIPWITFNGIWRKTEFDAALSNLKAMLCTNYLKNVPEC